MIWDVGRRGQPIDLKDQHTLGRAPALHGLKNASISGARTHPSVVLPGGARPISCSLLAGSRAGRCVTAPAAVGGGRERPWCPLRNQVEFASLRRDFRCSMNVCWSCSLFYLQSSGLFEASCGASNSTSQSELCMWTKFLFWHLGKERFTECQLLNRFDATFSWRFDASRVLQEYCTLRCIWFMIFLSQNNTAEACDKKCR